MQTGFCCRATSGSERRTTINGNVEGGATHVGKLSTYVSLNFIYAKILL